MNRRELSEDAAEFYELYRALPWYHRLHLRVLIAYKAKRCPVYMDRPAIRFTALYSAFLVVLTLFIHTHDFFSWFTACAGGALAWTVALQGGVGRVYVYLRRRVNSPGNSSGD